MNFFYGANYQAIALEATDTFSNLIYRNQVVYKDKKIMQISGITGMDCDDECVGQINKVQEMREIMELNQIVGNRYHVVREIGRGGMGIVYFAHDTKLNRPVAIKMIGVKCSAFSQGLERFCFEARVQLNYSIPISFKFTKPLIQIRFLFM